jgi:hypothetical protein
MQVIFEDSSGMRPNCNENILNFGHIESAKIYKFLILTLFALHRHLCPTTSSLNHLFQTVQLPIVVGKIHGSLFQDDAASNRPHSSLESSKQPGAFSLALTERFRRNYIFRRFVLLETAHKRHGVIKQEHSEIK